MDKPNILYDIQYIVSWAVTCLSGAVSGVDVKPRRNLPDCMSHTFCCKVSPNALQSLLCVAAEHIWGHQEKELCGPLSGLHCTYSIDQAPRIGPVVSRHGDLEQLAWLDDCIGCWQVLALTPAVHAATQPCADVMDISQALRAAAGLKLKLKLEGASLWVWQIPAAEAPSALQGRMRTVLPQGDPHGCATWHTP